MSRVLKPKKDDKEENLDQHLFKLPVLQGMAESEVETISALAFQIKYQNTEIRATSRLLMKQVSRIEGNYSTEIIISEKALHHQNKPKRMRRRDLITYKLNNKLELTKYEKRTWESKTNEQKLQIRLA